MVEMISNGPMNEPTDDPSEFTKYSKIGNGRNRATEMVRDTVLKVQ